MSEPVDDRTLEMFVSRKFHWKSLQTHQQLSMASELLKHRLVEKQMLAFIADSIDDRVAMRQYRSLVKGDE